MYLKRGQGIPLRVGPAVTNQRNILGFGDPEEEISMKEFLTLPSRVKELEKLVEELQKKINSGGK